VTITSARREKNSTEALLDFEVPHQSRATICPGCDVTMLESEGCATPLIAVAGMERERIPYGSEPYFVGPLRGRRCHDCHVTLGNLHHYACDFEACPACGGQALGCDCTTNAGGYACPVHGLTGLAMHRLTPLAVDPAGLDPEQLDRYVTVCTRCHNDTDSDG
jgi:hypothetical protein